MGNKARLLQQVMASTNTSQVALARMSGVHQPSISQFITGKTELSDRQLERLLNCMGYELHVLRQAVEPTLTHSERRSWILHRELATMLDPQTFSEWVPKLTRNLERLTRSISGEPHTENLKRWAELIRSQDINAMKRAMTGLDRNAVEMREVAPFSGFLPADRRSQLLPKRG